MKIKTDDYHSTPDLPMAAAISICFGNPEAIDRDPDDFSKVYFVFKRERGLDEFLERYWRGQIAVEPQAYASKLRELKARIHNEK